MQPALAQWPQYRGPQVDGSAELPGYDGEPIGLEIAWRVELGGGYSGIAIADGRAVTMFSQGESDFLAAFDLINGEELWRYEIGPTYPGHDGSHDGPISTPLIIDGRVIALGPRGRLFAVAATTGAMLWSEDLVGQHGAEAPWYGFASSPIRAGKNVVVHLGAADATLAAFDPATGGRRWSAGKDAAAYQNALVWSGSTPPALVAAGYTQLYGFDIEDGEVLWQYEYGGDGSEHGGGSLTPVPVGQGLLFLSHKYNASTVVRLGDTDGTTSIEEIWDNRAIRLSYDVPVFFEGNIYAYSSRFLVCVEAVTGQVRWRSRQPGDGFIGRLGELLVMQTKSGSLHLARADPDGYEELASVELFSEGSWTAPSFADGSIYARSFGELARVDFAEAPRPIARDPEAARDSERLVQGTHFARFLGEVRQAKDKESVVDDYLHSVESFPVLETENRIIFLYRGKTEDLAVAGDWIGVSAEELMQQVDGTDLYYHVAKLEPATRVSYRFIRDYEEILDPLNPRQTEIAIVGEDIEFSYGLEPVPTSWVALDDWREPHFLQPFQGDDKGRLTQVELSREDVAIELDVYLPTGYDNSERRYPVLYVLDGPNALRIGHYQNALDHLIAEGSVEPLIAVFMPRLPWRGEALDLALREFVMPSVDRGFRTLEQADSRVLLGTSGSAQTAFRFVLANPGTVGNVAVHSGQIFESRWARLLPLIRASTQEQIRIYHDWSRYDLQSPHENWILRDSNRQIFEHFRANGFDIHGGEVADGVGWPAWRNRTDTLLTTLFSPGAPAELPNHP